MADSGDMPGSLSATAAPGAFCLPAGTRLAFCRHAELTAGGAQRGRRARDFAAGRMAAARAARAAGGPCGCAIIVGRRPDGAPVWPAGLTGAISHSGDRAAALVGRAADHAGLGLDLEAVITHPEVIAPALLSPAEAALLGCAPSGLALTAVFSAREALFKALSSALSLTQSSALPVPAGLDLDMAEVAALGGSGGRLRLRRPAGPWPEGTAVPFRWTLSEGLVLAVLSLGPPRH